MPMVRVSNGGTAEITSFESVGVNGDSTFMGVVGDYYLAQTTITTQSTTGLTLVHQEDAVSGYYPISLWKCNATSCSIRNTRWVIHLITN